MTQDHIETFIERCDAEKSDYIVGTPVGGGDWHFSYSADSLGSKQDKMTPEDDLLVMISNVLTNES
jgi:hypothetical protein